MCGIVGYVGPREAVGIVVEGLHRLEYRGYDSAGVAVLDDVGISIRKKAGRVRELSQLLERQPLKGNVGIGHTRWATHGEANDNNSHPHLGGNGEVVIVHNGVIENYAPLRDHLQSLGYVFRSATDTEAIAHLISLQMEERIREGKNPTELETALEAVTAHSNFSRGHTASPSCSAISPTRSSRHAWEVPSSSGSGTMNTSWRAMPAH
ncbi:MAG: class II glutamine amidotransferase [Planctomycetales bacterium]